MDATGFSLNKFGCGPIKCESNPREFSKPATRNTRREEVTWASDRVCKLHCFLGRTPDSAAHILKLSTWKNHGDVMNLHRGTNSCDIPAGIKCFQTEWTHKAPEIEIAYDISAGTRTGCNKESMRHLGRHVILETKAMVLEQFPAQSKLRQEPGMEQWHWICFAATKEANLCIQQKQMSSMVGCDMLQLAMRQR